MKLNAKIKGKDVYYTVEPVSVGSKGKGFNVSMIEIDEQQYWGTDIKKINDSYIVQRVYRDFDTRMSIVMDILNEFKPLTATLEYEG